MIFMFVFRHQAGWFQVRRQAAPAGVAAAEQNNREPQQPAQAANDIQQNENRDAQVMHFCSSYLDFL